MFFKKENDLTAGLSVVGRAPFFGCSSLIDMIIPESVITVGSNAFASANAGFTLICAQNQLQNIMQGRTTFLSRLFLRGMKNGIS